MELTPKQKAEELHQKIHYLKDCGVYIFSDGMDSEVTQVALFVVSEIENQLTPIEKAPNNKEAFEYWQEVKQELLKIK